MEAFRIAVTGGNGFVGSALVKMLTALPDRGRPILSICRRRADQPSGLVEAAGYDDADLPAKLQGVKVFIHAAGKSAGKPEDLWEANVTSLQRYIDILPASVEQIIHFSSVNVLFPELSLYGEAKQKAEQLWTASPFASRVTVLRPALIYGPGDRKNIGRLINLVDRFPIIPLPAGGSLRPVFLQDVVDLVACLIGGQPWAGKALVVSGSEETRYLDLARRLAHIMGRQRIFLPVPAWLLAPFTWAVRLCGLKRWAQSVDGYYLRRPWHDPALWEHLGRPPISLDEGLRRCIAAYQSMG
jgi:NADH dehydrogenase